MRKFLSCVKILSKKHIQLGVIASYLAFNFILVVPYYKLNILKMSMTLKMSNILKITCKSNFYCNITVNLLS